MIRRLLATLRDIWHASCPPYQPGEWDGGPSW
jgi:hypothetical protein